MFAFKEKPLAELYWYKYNIAALTQSRAEIARRVGTNGAPIGIDSATQFCQVKQALS